MKLVVDVNVLISSLIKDSVSRKIIVTSGFDFFFPEPALEKIRKYKEYILKKSGLSDLEYRAVFYTLISFMSVVTREDVSEHWSQATQIMAHIDEEDVLFVAAALSRENGAVWSDDTHFDRQDRILVLKTADMIALMQG
jgi:predicted nucleic acid-binding protein